MRERALAKRGDLRNVVAINNQLSQELHAAFADRLDAHHMVII